MTLGTTGRAPHKSALLNHLQTMADGDFEIMRFDAVESEAALGFAALQQLPRPHPTQLPKPPDPQREALCQVFGLELPHRPVPPAARRHRHRGSRTLARGGSHPVGPPRHLAEDIRHPVETADLALRRIGPPTAYRLRFRTARPWPGNALCLAAPTFRRDRRTHSAPALRAQPGRNRDSRVHLSRDRHRRLILHLTGRAGKQQASQSPGPSRLHEAQTEHSARRLLEEM